MKNLLLILVFSLLASTVADANDAPSIVVIVNPASGVDQLTRDEVIDIFLGRYRKLPSGRAALPIDVAESSAERARFYQLLVKKSSTEMSARTGRVWCSPARLHRLSRCRM